MNHLEQARAYTTTAPLAVSGRNGHGTTFKVACTLLHGFALSADKALKLMVEYNGRLDEPWTKSELKHKVEDADKTTSRLPKGYKLVRHDPYKRTPPAAPAQRVTWKIVSKTPPAANREPGEETQLAPAAAAQDGIVLLAPTHCAPCPKESFPSAHMARTRAGPGAQLNPARAVGNQSQNE